MDPQPTLSADFKGVGLFYNLGIEGATFKPAITITFSYKDLTLPAGASEKDLVIAWRDADGKWNPVPSTADTNLKTVSALISHFTPYGLVIPPAAVPTTTTTTPTATTTTPITTTTSTTTTTITTTPVTSTTTTSTTPKPASFNVSQLTISPNGVKPGQTVTISVTAQNTGDVAGTYDVALKIDYVLVNRQTIKLAAGAKNTVTFTLSRNAAKEYAIDVNGLAGTFTVTGPTATTTKPPVTKSYPWVIFVGAGAFLLTLVATIIVGLRRGSGG